jgi:hypothetical protein
MVQKLTKRQEEEVNKFNAEWLQDGSIRNLYSQRLEDTLYEEFEVTSEENFCCHPVHSAIFLYFYTQCPCTLIASELSLTLGYYKGVNTAS